MPAAALVAPICLAALAIAAISLISYTIINNKKKEKSYHSGGYFKPSDDSDQGAPSPDKSKKSDEDSDDDPDTPSSRKPPKSATGTTIEDNDELGICNNLGGLRKRRRCTCRESDNLFAQNYETNNENPISNETAGNISENTQENGDESDSSESNNSIDSIETSSSSVLQNTRYMENCVQRNENHNISKRFNADYEDSSTSDGEEEMYKRKVYENLKSDIESSIEVNSSHDEEKDHKSFDDKSSDFSDSASDSHQGKKRKLCEGCEEELANAIAHPCKHCYLCIVCAFKIHRIYKKCKYCSANVTNYEFLQI